MLQLDPLAVQQLQALLLASRVATVKLIRKCPQMLAMQRQELIQRLVGMKASGRWWWWMAGRLRRAVGTELICRCLHCCHRVIAAAAAGGGGGVGAHSTADAISASLAPPLCACALPLQELFPGSDVARMIELAPGLFLESPWPQTQAQLEAASTLLRRELQGAEVDFMFQVSE